MRNAVFIALTACAPVPRVAAPPAEAPPGNAISPAVMTTAQSDAGSVEPAERPRPVEATADAPKLVPTVADVVVRGDGSRATISEFATRHADAMARACREVAEVGRVTVGFSVAEDGTVSEPAVLGGGAMSLDERPLAGCVAQQIHAWRFAEGQASSVVLYLRWADPHKLPAFGQIVNPAVRVRTRASPSKLHSLCPIAELASMAETADLSSSLLWPVAEDGASASAC